MMTTRELTVRFVTPAFLGDAEQNGAWRTPPFKALLRQWWRVAVAKDFQYDHRAMRNSEGKLFGHAWLENDRDEQGREISARKSAVRLRLASWCKGTLESAKWPGGAMDDVVTTRDGKGRVRSDVYLGYGPVLPPSKKQGRARIGIRRAIGSNQDNHLQIAYPDSLAAAVRLEDVMTLIRWFGAIGSRARNGWGSVDLDDKNPVQGIRDATTSGLWPRVSRPWQECLETPSLDWPHAVGVDSKRPLIWLIDDFSDWRKAMGRLAMVRVEIRRAAKGLVGPRGIGGIHVLGYPAGGKWELAGVSNDLRLATQLRFKVLPSARGTLAAVAYHMPCAIPRSFMSVIGADRERWLAENQFDVWQQVHAVLDQKMQRIG